MLNKQIPSLCTYKNNLLSTKFVVGENILMGIFSSVFFVLYSHINTDSSININQTQNQNWNTKLFYFVWLIKFFFLLFLFLSIIIIITLFDFRYSCIIIIISNQTTNKTNECYEINKQTLLFCNVWMTHIVTIIVEVKKNLLLKKNKKKRKRIWWWHPQTHKHSNYNIHYPIHTHVLSDW